MQIISHLYAINYLSHNAWHINVNVISFILIASYFEKHEIGWLYFIFCAIILPVNSCINISAIWLLCNSPLWVDDFMQPFTNEPCAILQKKWTEGNIVFYKRAKGKQKVFVQLMKCRVYCKHESFVSSEIGIKIVIIKCNIVNSLFIALKMNRYSVSRSALYFRHFGVKVQIHVISFYRDWWMC